MDLLWNDPKSTLTKWKTPLFEDEKIVELPVDQRTVTRRYTQKAIDFVKAHRDKPFFVYLPHSMPHIPLYVPDDVRDPDPKNAYINTIEHIDTEVGRLLDVLDELLVLAFVDRLQAALFGCRGHLLDGRCLRRDHNGRLRRGQTLDGLQTADVLSEEQRVGELELVLLVHVLVLLQRLGCRLLLTDQLKGVELRGKHLQFGQRLLVLLRERSELGGESRGQETRGSRCCECRVEGLRRRIEMHGLCGENRRLEGGRRREHQRLLLHGHEVGSQNGELHGHGNQKRILRSDGSVDVESEDATGSE